MRRRTIVATLAVVWAAFVILRSAAGGFSFNGGAYGQGQMAAVVLAAVVLIVAGRELLKARGHSAS